MKEKIELILQDCLNEIQSAKTNKELLQEIKIRYLGKSGSLTMLLRGMKDLSAEEKPLFGQALNQAKEAIEAAFIAIEREIKENELRARLETEALDISADIVVKPLGSLHPIAHIIRQASDIFVSLGFEVLEGPEIESDYYNFQALNIPPDHPSRDMQDTFYISESFLLRTHTSPNQVRRMQKGGLPIKMICPGKTYRVDNDASHSPIFHQIEGLVVDKNLTLCDLMGLLGEFAKRLFDETTRVRFRPSYFPFTEPSVEVDLSCTNCHGKGCSLCKGTGWIEVLGAGMVNPFVLENSGINPEEYRGFAFGMGIERIAMIKYGISDIRLMYENDIRFLKQFK